MKRCDWECVKPRLRNSVQALLAVVFEDMLCVGGNILAHYIPVARVSTLITSVCPDVALYE